MTLTTSGRAAKPQTKTKKAPKKKAPKKTKEQLAQATLKRVQRRDVRFVFETVGFRRAAHGTDKQFTFDGMTSDFDDIFLLQNLVVLVEYTISASTNISDHLKKKDLLYKSITDNPQAFLEFAKGEPLAFTDDLLADFDISQLEVRIIYCSRFKVDRSLKQQVNFITYLDYEILHYFRSVTMAIRESARAELLDFLGVTFDCFGEAVHKPGGGVSTSRYEGSVLPEAHSYFPAGYKVVTFYMDPESLLERAYVLRRDGWREGGAVYQRLILRSKIEALRKYLLTEERVFVNNIIVTLPPSTRIEDLKGHTVQTATLVKTSKAVVTIPEAFNSVGIIDGQHRLFSYHKGGTDDAKIKNYRSRQNLLVTGIVYPDAITSWDRERFEAKLFLEINSNQTNAKSDLRQAIDQILHPFADSSVARAVLLRLNDTGPLSDVFQRYPFETHLLKTTTIVSYGLRPLVRLGSGPMFTAWSNAKKLTMASSSDDSTLEAYIDYCVSYITGVFAAVRMQLGTDVWRIKSRMGEGVLSTTFVNGLLGALRQGLEAGIDMSLESAKLHFKDIAKFPFSAYKSSQYTVMSTELAARYLHIPKQSGDTPP